MCFGARRKKEKHLAMHHHQLASQGVVLQLHGGGKRKHNQVSDESSEQWFTDAHIKFGMTLVYMEFQERFQERLPNVAFLTAAEMRYSISANGSGEKIKSILHNDLVFIPITNADESNPEGSHWSILIHWKGAFWHYDSLLTQSKNSDFAQKVVCNANPNPGITSMDTYQQSDGFNCGPCVVTTVRQFLTKVVENKDYTPSPGEKNGLGITPELVYECRNWVICKYTRLTSLHCYLNKQEY